MGEALIIAGVFLGSAAIAVVAGIGFLLLIALWVDYCEKHMGNGDE